MHPDETLTPSAWSRVGAAKSTFLRRCFACLITLVNQVGTVGKIFELLKRFKRPGFDFVRGI